MLRGFLLAVFYLAVIFGLVYWAGWSAIQSVLALLTPKLFLQMVLLIALILGINALNLWVLYRKRIAVSNRIFAKAYLQSWVLSHFLPAKLGDFSMAVFLRKEKKVGESAALIALDKAITLAINVLLGLFLLWWMKWLEPLHVLVLGLVLVFLVVLLWQLLKKIPNRFPVFLQEFSKEIVFVVKENQTAIGINALLTVVRLGFQAVLIWIVFDALHAPLALFGALGLRIIEQLAVIVSVTPNGIGLREPLLSASASALGASVGVSVAAVLVLQAVEWLIVALFSGLWIKDVMLALKAKPKKN